MLPVDNTRSLLISICQMADYIIFFRKYLNNCDKFKDLWEDGKFTYVLLTGRTQIKRDFSVNKEYWFFVCTEFSLWCYQSKIEIGN